MMKFIPSPNFDSRKGAAVKYIILHYTGMQTGQGALARLCDPEAKVSSHYVIYENGDTVQMVKESDRAWHAGVSSWQGVEDINTHSIGIELVNKGHEWGYENFPESQIKSLIALCKKINVPAKNILAHSDIAPTRKLDPGERFPWAELAKHRLGHYLKPFPLEDGTAYRLGDKGSHVQGLQFFLTQLGFKISQNGEYDAEMVAVVTAFQRHWRQERVDGVADLSTMKTLKALL